MKSVSPPRPALPPAVLGALRRFRLRHRTVRILAGLGITLAVSAFALGAALALDRYVILPDAARPAVTLAALAAAVLAAAALVLRPLLRPLPALRVARALEAAFPDLDERLITLVELSAGRPAAAGESPELLDALARSTAARLDGFDARPLIDSRPARGALAAGAIASLVLLGAAASSPRSFGQLLDRFVHPGADLPRPSTVALEVLPGDCILGDGDDLQVAARAARGRPHSARLLYRSPGGSWREAAMEPLAGGAETAPEFRRALKLLRETTEYRVAAGDFISRVFTARVEERPRPLEFRIAIRYPEYTRRPESSAAAPRGDVAAVAGSRAVVEARFSRDLARAEIRIDGEDIEPRPLAVDGDSVRAEIEVRRSTAYRLHAVDRLGISNQWGEPYAIRAEPDRPPELRVIEPRAAAVVIEEGRFLDLRLEARDDFGVESMALSEGRPGEPPRSVPLELDVPSRLAFPLRRRWDPAALELRPGEAATIRISARDGLGQETRTPPITARVAFLPAPPEGPEWLPRLGGLQAGIDGALAAWEELIARCGIPPGGAWAADPARAERLGAFAEEVLRQPARWRLTAEEAASLGRSLPIPSVHRGGLEDLALRLARLAGAEGMAAWRAALDAAAAIRAAAEGASVPAQDLERALAGARDRLAALRDGFAAIHRSERLEEALDRALALADLERSLAERFRLSGESKGQQAIRAEAAALGADLLAISRLGGGADRQLEIVSRVHLDTAIPRLEEAERAAAAGEERAAVIQRIEAAARALDDQARNIAREAERWEKAALQALAALELEPRLQERLAALAAREREVAGKVESLAALPEGRREAMEEIAGLDRALAAAAREVLEDLSFLADRAERFQPPDYESAVDLAQLRDLLAPAVEAEMAAAAADLEALRARIAAAAGREEIAAAAARQAEARRERAGLLSEMGAAAGGILLGARIGLAARGLDAAAAAEEGIAWKLRGLEPEHRRALRVIARAQGELRKVLERARREAEAIDAALPAVLRAERRPQSSSAAPIAAALEAAAKGAASALAADPPAALDASLAAARSAGEAALRLDRVREDGLPDLEAARAWIRRRAGTLAARAMHLAAAERDLAVRIAAAAGADAAAENAPGIAALEGEQAGLAAEAEALGRAAALESARLAAAAADPEIIQDLDGAAARLRAAAQGEMAAAARVLGAAAAAAEPRRAQAVAEAGKLAAAAAAALEEIAQALRLLEEGSALAAAEGSLESIARQGEESEPDPSTPEAIARAAAEAKALLEAAALAIETLSARLPAGALKDRLLELLGGAMGKFRAAGEAAGAGDGRRARDLLAEGRGLLEEAVALVRRQRGENEEALAEARRNAARPAEGEERPRSREMEEVLAEMRRIQELRGWQKRLEAQIEELLRDPSLRTPEKAAELAQLQRDLAAAMGEHFLTTEQLLGLVADLLGAEKEARRIAAAELEMAAEARGAAGVAPERAAALAEEERGLIRAAEAAAATMRAAGPRLSINLLKVIAPFWDAEGRVDPALDAMRRAEQALAETKLVTADEELRRAAAELGAVAELLSLARATALEEIADRDAQSALMDLGPAGMERAVRSLEEAARELARNNLEAARTEQQAAARGMAAGTGSLRAYLERLRRNPGREGALLSQILEQEAARRAGLAWSVAARGSERDPVSEMEDQMERAAMEISERFPEEYRELVRIYLKALAGER